MRGSLMIVGMQFIHLLMCISLATSCSLLNEDFGLLRFYTEEITQVEDVQSVETFVVYKGYHERVPYIL